MYTIKQTERQAINEIASIAHSLAQLEDLDKNDLCDAKASVRKVQYLINVVLDRWEEERLYS